MSTKVWAASFLDPALNYLKTNANKICLCSAEPTTYVGATDTVYLAGTSLVSGDFTGPSDGLVSGRRLMIAQKPGVIVSATGDARYIALVSTTTSTLLYVGKCSPVGITLGSTIIIDTSIIELKDAF